MPQTSFAADPGLCVLFFRELSQAYSPSKVQHMKYL